LATITGSVRDNKGNPLAGALVSLLKEGVKNVVKEARTDRQGNFIARVLPGRYGIRAIANGFTEVSFDAVDVRASQELSYKFNLEPIGNGNTLPERRRDRDDVKWVLRSAQGRRSVFQIREGEDADVQAATQPNAAEQNTGMETAVDGSQPETLNEKSKPVGVVEAYTASNAYGASYAGLNFAVATPVTEGVELIFAGQTGIGPEAPERLEATTRFNVGHRHKVGVTAAGLRLNSHSLFKSPSSQEDFLGQVSLRAIDEWIVRDGIVIVMGLDYSRFVGAGEAHSITPRSPAGTISPPGMLTGVMPDRLNTSAVMPVSRHLRFFKSSQLLTGVLNQPRI